MNEAAIYLREDSIAACSTPPGRGAVAVVRLSGPATADVVNKIFVSKSQPPKQSPRRMVFGAVCDPESGAHIDDVLCVFFRAPHSYTGEDLAEFHCHGSEAVVRKLLEVLYGLDIRPAEPGEFSFRAVRNGKMDLTQAEGVASLIDSRSQLARSLSLRMLEGEMSNDLHALKTKIVDIAVEVETFIEFPDDAAEETVAQNLAEKIDEVVDGAHRIESKAFREQRFEQGIVVVLAGRPNVGKSSLFNRLLGRERAIVTPHPGTTRDSIEGTIELAGFPVTLIDTAGLRETQEEIEAIGIERSRQLLTTSHIILFIFEADHGLTGEDRELLESIEHASQESKIVLVANKSDLLQGSEPVQSNSDLPCIQTSATSDNGLDGLLAYLQADIKDMVPAEGDSAYMITARQERILLNCVETLDRTKNYIEDRAPLELLAEELRAALHFIAQLDGTGIAPDIMNTIFSRFCIGK